MSKIKAYVVTYDGWLAYWAAETEEQARYDVYRHVFRHITNGRLTDLEVRRFPDLDDHAQVRDSIELSYEERAYFKKKYKLEGGRERYGV